MTDPMEMARAFFEREYGVGHKWATKEHLKSLAALITKAREDEREACAALVIGMWGDTHRPFRKELASKIRARGDVP